MPQTFLKSAGRIFALLLVTGLRLRADEAPRANAHPVMIWVPPYGIAPSKARLNESFDGASIQDGISHLALQFWSPTKEGGIERVSRYGNIPDDVIADFRTWTRAHGIRLMLCVYNGENGWDWSLAQAGFKDHPDTFVEALATEVERLGLDGVDIDLEGPGSFDADRPAYVAFVTELSKRLHAKGRHLTADSFSYIWNAPNQSWWPELLPLVDGLTTMGYHEIGVNGAKWRAYSAQKEAAGSEANKLMIGMPSSKDSWQDNELSDQLKWVKANDTGLSIWDARLRAPAWQTKECWQAVGAIRDGK